MFSRNTDDCTETEYISGYFSFTDVTSAKLREKLYRKCKN